MSYAFAPEASLDSLIDHVSGVIAGLEATPSLAPLAAPWHKLRKDLLAARQTRDETRWKLLGAQRKVAVSSVEWGVVVGDLSGRALLAAGKNVRKDPYASLFTPLRAAVLRTLGPVRAIAAAAVIAAKGAALAHPELVKCLAALKTATEALSAVEADRSAAQQASLVLDIARSAQVTALDKLTATTELGILTKFPGRSDLVRAALAPARSTPKSKPTAADPTTPPESET